MSVFVAPPANFGMGLPEAAIRAEMSGRRDAADGQPGAVNAIIADKRFWYLSPDFNHPVIQVKGDVAAGARETNGADKQPNLAARLKDEIVKVIRIDVVMHDSCKSWLAVRYCDVVARGGAYCSLWI